MVSKIISGGQTGADRAALDWAIAHAMPHGGWCPAGRRAEDGPLAMRYQLSETTSRGYRARTVRNVCQGDGTLITNLGEMEGGTLETLRIAKRRDKPVSVVQLDESVDGVIDALRGWLDERRIEVLNVAGPRESKRPGIYEATYDLLCQVLAGQSR